MLYAESTILDPRFKGRVFKSEDAFKKATAELKRKLVSMRLHIVPPESVVTDNAKQQLNLDDDDDDDVWKDFDSAYQKVSKPTNKTAAAIREMDKYLAEE